MPTTGTNTGNDGLIGKAQTIARPHVERCHFIGKITDCNHLVLLIIQIGQIQPHSTSGFASVVKSQPTGHADLFERSVTTVVEQEVLHGIVGHHQIQEPVLIQIGREHAKRLAGWHAGRRVVHLNTGRCRYINKTIVCAFKQPRMGTGIIGRRPIGSAHTRQPVVDNLINFAGPLHVVGNDQVQIPIIVHIKECGAGGPILLTAGHTPGIRFVQKLLALLIDKQFIAAYSSQIDIPETITINIGNGYTHAIQSHGFQSNLLGHIGKLSRAIVGKQLWNTTSDLLVPPGPTARVH